MRKVSVRFTILCILILLIGVTALAASGRVSNMQKQDVNVTVETTESESGEPMFHITRTNAENGKLYTVLIRSGEENANPSGGENGNLVYMDVVEAKNGEVNISQVYPKTMTAGTYRVFISDYGKKSIVQAATFDVDGKENPDNKLELGDVDGKDGIEPVDALMALQIASHLIEWTDEQYVAADVDCTGEVEPVDAMLILQKSAHLIEEFPTNSGQS